MHDYVPSTTVTLVNPIVQYFDIGGGTVLKTKWQRWTWPLLLAPIQQGKAMSDSVIPLIIVNSLESVLWERIVQISQFSDHSTEQLLFLLFICFLL